MDLLKLKREARNSLKGRFLDIVKFFGLYILIILTLEVGLILYTMNFNNDSAYILSVIISIFSNGLLTFGYYSYFLKISRNEEVKYYELLKKFKLFIPCVSIALLVGIFTLLGTLLFIIPGIIAYINYYFVFYIALDNPELDDIEVLKASKEIMYGHKFEFFVLIISFFGWYILGLFTFGLLYFWLTPYMMVTFANFYNEIKDEF